MRRKGAAVFGAIGMLFVFLLTSCGGGGGAANSKWNNGIGNTMTVTVTTAGGGADATTTYTEGAINGYGYYDPDLEADIMDSGRAVISLTSGVNGGTMPVTLVSIVTSGHAAGAYPVDGDRGSGPFATYVFYKDHTEYYDSVISSGTVTIDKIGNVRDPVIGSFSAVVLCTSSTQTHGISGTFNVKRTQQPRFPAQRRQQRTSARGRVARQTAPLSLTPAVEEVGYRETTRGTVFRQSINQRFQGGRMAVIIKNLLDNNMHILIIVSPR